MYGRVTGAAITLTPRRTKHLFLKAEKLDFARMQSEWMAERTHILNRLDDEELRNSIKKGIRRTW